MNEKQSSIAIEIDSIDANTSAERVIYVRAHNVGDRNFVVKVFQKICSFGVTRID